MSLLVLSRPLVLADKQKHARKPVRTGMKRPTWSYVPESGTYYQSPQTSATFMRQHIAFKLQLDLQFRAWRHRLHSYWCVNAIKYMSAQPPLLSVRSIQSAERLNTYMCSISFKVQAQQRRMAALKPQQQVSNTTDCTTYEMCTYSAPAH